MGVLLGDGGGAFGAATTIGTGGSAPYSPVVADFNGDGKLDIVVANHGSDTLSVLLGNGAGGFSLFGAPFSTGGTGLFSLAVADVNSDGQPDIVVANFNSDTVSVLLGNGAGGFASASSPVATGGSGPRSVAVVDLNGDGRVNFADVNDFCENNTGVSDQTAGSLPQCLDIVAPAGGES